MVWACSSCPTRVKKSRARPWKQPLRTCGWIFWGGGSFPCRGASPAVKRWRRCRASCSSSSPRRIPCRRKRHLSCGSRSCASGLNRLCRMGRTSIRFPQEPLSIRVCSRPGSSRGFTLICAIPPSRLDLRFFTNGIPRIRSRRGISLSRFATSRTTAKSTRSWRIGGGCARAHAAFVGNWGQASGSARWNQTSVIPRV